MSTLIDEAIAKAKAGGAKPDEPDAFKEAVKEAYEAMKADDFDGFSTALESAITIRLSRVEQ